MHDVAKIFKPAAIPPRPGGLNSPESEMIERHGKLGTEILARAALPWPIAEAALRPCGTTSDWTDRAIPWALEATKSSRPRRSSRADVIEAPAHHGPYRPALGLDLSLTEMGAATKFDVDDVRAGMAVFEAGFTFSSVNSVSPVGTD